MVKCNCGKEIVAVPSWLQGVKVNFVCNNCPDRNLLGITQVDLMGVREEEPVLAHSTGALPADAKETDETEEDSEEEA